MLNVNLEEVIELDQYRSCKFVCAEALCSVGNMTPVGCDCGTQKGRKGTARREETRKQMRKSDAE